MNDFYKFLIELLWRSFAVFGFAFFGVSGALLLSGSMTLGFAFQSSFFSAGAYFFIELRRYFNISEDDVLKKMKLNKCFTFLIFP